MIDVTHQIASVDRRVGDRTLDAGEARTVTVSRVYDTTLADLWDACIDAGRVSRWFLPLSGDLREGGRYALEGNASGTISRCDPSHGYDLTWEYGGDITWVELRLAAEPGGGTRLTIEHIAHVGDDRWARFGPGAVGLGWDGALLGLTLHVDERQDRPDRAAIEAWQRSDEGRDFLRRGGEAWGAADEAWGTDPEAARAAAARTIEAYTGG